MKAIIISISVLIVLLIFLAQVQIQINPFKVLFGRPYYAIGWVLIVVGISFIQIDSERKALKEAFNTASKIVEEVYDINNKLYKNE